MTKNTPDAKNRILQAAVRIFAQKSFDGSRIDEIAREAGVPKSLIYYHFKGKDHILEVLTQDFLDKYLRLMGQAVGPDGKEDMKGLEGRVQDRYYAFGKENEDLLRVMLTDSLKKSNKAPSVFRIVEESVKAQMALNPGEAYGDPKVANRKLVVDFFSMLMPLYSFICFSEAWVEYFGMDPQEFGRLFLDSVIKPHVEYHENHDNPTV